MSRGYAFGYLGMILTILLVVAAVLFAAFVIGYVVYWCARNRLSPTRRASAKVIRKRHKQWDASVPTTGGMISEAFLNLTGEREAPEVTLAEGTDCYVTFEVNGKETEFPVPMSTYVALEEGAEGLLVFQGERFKHFIPLTGDSWG